MKIITGARASGKTTELLRRLPIEGNGYIVVRSKQVAKIIFEYAQSFGLEINFPLTFNEFIENRYWGKRVDWIVIDDAEALLQYIAHPGVAIYSITISGEIIDCGKSRLIKNYWGEEI
ncbi:AAA+ ATPase superfamily predicted ATPase [Elusimicrobium simillimum]|uniref:hypothetical protein n=1 Tax=Elusimicrobium simillimum TaxID=3143438 RepID=UPI003C6EE4AE